MILLPQNRDVGLNPSLRVQEERITALAGFQLLDMIRRHRMQEPLAVLAEGLNAAAMGKFK